MSIDKFPILNMQDHIKAAVGNFCKKSETPNQSQEECLSSVNHTHVLEFKLKIAGVPQLC